MVTILRHTVYDTWIHDVRCLSTDTKPTEGIHNGSTLMEIDTGKGYLFDAVGKQWHELEGGGTIVIPSASGVSF